MAIVKERSNDLMKAFQEGRHLSIDDIKQIVNAKSKQSVYNYLEICKDCGMVITNYREGRKVFYKLLDEENNLYQEKMNKDACDEYVIMKYLLDYGYEDKNHTIPAAELKEKLVSEEHIDTLSLGLNCGRTRFYELLGKLEQEHMITKIKKGSADSYYLATDLGMKVSANLFDKRKDDELTSLYYKLSLIPENDPYFYQLKKLYNKLHVILREEDESTKEDKSRSIRENYLLYGKKYYEIEKFAMEYKKIANYDYSHKILKIKFKNVNTKNTYLDLGYVLYSYDTDKIYLFGEEILNPYATHNPSNKKCKLIIIDEKIDSIEETELPNRFYKSESAGKQLRSMVGVNEEQPEAVKFLVSDKCSEEQKFQIERLVHETSSKLVKTEKGYLFEGEIAGRSNLRIVLCGLGENLLEVQSENLQKIFHNLVQFSLEHYEEVLAYEQSNHSNSKSE